MGTGLPILETGGGWPVLALPREMRSPCSLSVCTLRELGVAAVTEASLDWNQPVLSWPPPPPPQALNVVLSCRCLVLSVPGSAPVGGGPGSLLVLLTSAFFP